MPFYGESVALFVALLWSLGSFIVTSAAQKVGAIQLNIDRLVLGTIYILITAWILNIDFTMSLSQIMWLSASGIVGMFLGDSFLFRAFKEIGPRFGLLVFSLNPAIAAIIAYFTFGEDLGLWGMLGISITLSGIGMVVMDKRKFAENKFQINTKGVVYAALAAIGQGTGLVLAKMAYTESHLHFFAATSVRLIAAFLCMLPLAILFKKYKNPIKLYAADTKIFALIALATFMGTYLGVSLSYEAVTNAKVGIASTIMSSMPILMLPMSYFYFKEKIGIKGVLGAVLAVGGIAALFMV